MKAAAVSFFCRRDLVQVAAFFFFFVLEETWFRPVEEPTAPCATAAAATAVSTASDAQPGAGGEVARGVIVPDLQGGFRSLVAVSTRTLEVFDNPVVHAQKGRRAGERDTSRRVGGAVRHGDSERGVFRTEGGILSRR